MCSNNSMTKILGISDKKLKIISSDYKNIKGIRYMVINAQITYSPKVCTKCGCINEKYSIVKMEIKQLKFLLIELEITPLS